MYQKYSGVILKKYPLGEADELLTIYTKERGKLRLRARGVRRIQSRLAGNLQTLNEIEFETAQAVRGANHGSLPVIISTRTRTINDYLRENLKKFAFALVGVETLYRLTADQEENLEIYESLLNFLRSVGESADENAEVRKFQLKLLAASGYEFPKGSKGNRGDRGDRGREGELEIDEFLDYVLEREIKSKRFLRTLRLLDHE